MGIDLGELQRLLPGLNALGEALLIARLRQDDLWSRALSVARLGGLGLTRHDCRELIDRGLAAADGPLGASGRVAMTDDGLVLLQKAVPIGGLSPLFDRGSRKLSVAGQVVLPLPVHARNLTTFLGAMEDARWAARVKAPLDGRPSAGDPHYVAVTAHRLSTRQGLIDFHGDDGAATWNWRLAGNANGSTKV
jgi:hypothetical protein